VLHPDEGEIRFDGKPVHIPHPKAARAMGIGMVFQHFSLFEALTVLENIALAVEDSKDLAVLAKRIEEVSQHYGLPLDPRRLVHSLSVGERQRIEIVRVLLGDPKLLILDEPTSVLTPQEADTLFETLRRIEAEGRSILYISHKLDEVRRLAARATVLRHGRRVATCDPRQETPASLARMMVGADVADVHTAALGDEGAVRLHVSGLSLPAADTHGVALRDVSLEVRGGEIVGIAGVAGNGQEELFAALSGELTSGLDVSIRIDGKPVGRAGINARRRLGAAFVPEERLGHATAPDMLLSDNVLVSRHATSGFVRGGLVDRSATLALVERVTQAFDVRKGTRDPKARALSGGNLQKFVVGRDLLRDPGVLVVSQPTWGVDAGAAALIRQALVDLAARGAEVVEISQDLDELFEISHRLAVLFHGQLSAARPAGQFTREAMGLLMGGARLAEVA
jgi:simple sugar transport system ATP-binding protein